MKICPDYRSDLPTYNRRSSQTAVNLAKVKGKSRVLREGKMVRRIFSVSVTSEGQDQKVAATKSKTQDPRGRKEGRVSVNSYPAG